MMAETQFRVCFELTEKGRIEHMPTVYLFNSKTTTKQTFLLPYRADIADKTPICAAMRLFLLQWSDYSTMVSLIIHVVKISVFPMNANM